MEPVPPRQSRRRRQFESAFKAEIVRLIVDGRRSYKQVAADFDLVETCIRDWVPHAAISTLLDRPPRAAGRSRSTRAPRTGGAAFTIELPLSGSA